MTAVRYSRHALDRMAEMGVDRLTVESILGNPSLTRPSDRAGHGARMAVSDRYPRYAVVYHPNEPTGPYVVVTVVFRTYDEYTRDGETFRRKEDG